MRLIFTLASLIVFSFAANTQNITGIWRGYFSSSNGLYRDGSPPEMYKYEIQIDQQSNNSLKGVTYSYKSTIFYGKATLQGIFTAQTKNLILKEVKLVELKIGDLSEPCLMTCYLDYNRIGKLEVLQGTFISVNANNKADCGSGKVYLEKVTESDFEKEDFLLKKNPEAARKTERLSERLANRQPNSQPKTANTNTGTNKTTTAPTTNNKTSVTTKVNKTIPPTTPKKTVNPQVKANTPSTQQNIPGNRLKNTNLQKPKTPPPPPVKAPETWKPNVTVESVKKDTVIHQRRDNMTNKGPIPKVLLERENNLVQTIYTSEHFLQVDIFDNGTIDNDTISLYHNNQLVISHGKLNVSAMTVKIKCDENDSRHELILVAENLGEIPPNTALMVITAGKKRYEIFLTSNEQRNAKVVIEYRPEK